MTIDTTRRPRPARSVLAWVLLVLGVLATPAGLLSTWTSHQLLDTRTFTQTAAPLAGEPAVQQLVAGRITGTMTGALERIVPDDVLSGLLPNWLPDGVGNRLDAGAEELRGRVGVMLGDLVDTAVASPAFATVWERGIRTSHERAIAGLRGTDPVLLAGEDGRLSISIGPLIEQLGDELEARGIPFASQLPSVDQEITILQYSDLDQAKAWVGVIDATAGWLPWLGLALLLGAILLAPRVTPAALGLLSVLLALCGGILDWAGRVLSDWALQNTVGPDFMQLLFGEFTDSLQAWLLTAALVIGLAAVVTALLPLLAVHDRMRVLALFLILAASLALLLAGNLSLTAMLWLTLVAATTVILSLEWRTPDRTGSTVRPGVAGREG